MSPIQSDTPFPILQERFHNGTCLQKKLHDEKTAKAFFKTMCSRLLQAEVWKKWGGNKNADCKLCDRYGNETERPIRMFDYFRMSTKPEHKKGTEAYEWLRVEALERYEAPEEELMLISVRQVHQPDFERKDFLNGVCKQPTNSFMVKRVKRSVYVELLLCNEQSRVPVTVFEKACHVITGAVTSLGSTAFQWKKLAKQLISSVASGDH